MDDLIKVKDKFEHSGLLNSVFTVAKSLLAKIAMSGLMVVSPNTRNDITQCQGIIDDVRKNILGTSTGGYPMVNSGNDLPPWFNFILPFVNQLKTWIMTNISEPRMKLTLTDHSGRDRLKKDPRPTSYGLDMVHLKSMSQTEPGIDAQATILVEAIEKALFAFQNSTVKKDVEQLENVTNNKFLKQYVPEYSVDDIKSMLTHINPGQYISIVNEVVPLEDKEWISNQTSTNVSDGPRPTWMWVIATDNGFGVEVRGTHSSAFGTYFCAVSGMFPWANGTSIDTIVGALTHDQFLQGTWGIGLSDLLPHDLYKQFLRVKFEIQINGEATGRDAKLHLHVDVYTVSGQTHAKKYGRVYPIDLPSQKNWRTMYITEDLSPSLHERIAIWIESGDLASNRLPMNANYIINLVSSEVVSVWNHSEGVQYDEIMWTDKNDIQHHLESYDETFSHIIQHGGAKVEIDEDPNFNVRAIWSTKVKPFEEMYQKIVLWLIGYCETQDPKIPINDKFKFLGQNFDLWSTVPLSNWILTTSPFAGKSPDDTGKFLDMLLADLMEFGENMDKVESVSDFVNEMNHQSSSSCKKLKTWRDLRSKKLYVNKHTPNTKVLNDVDLLVKYSILKENEKMLTEMKGLTTK